MSEIVHANWVRDQIFILQDRSGYPLLMTQPEGVNGADLLPLSVIGCSLWDIAAILLKQRQPFTGLSASAESTREPEPPWRFRKIHIHYKLSGDGLHPKQVRRAIDLSTVKYCSTYATLLAAVEITNDFEILTSKTQNGSPKDAPSGLSNSVQAEIARLTITNFNQALNERRLDDMMALLTEDTVFENTYPPPDGTRYEGKVAVRSFWKNFFDSSRESILEIEELFPYGDRPVMRWKYRWIGLDGSTGHIRGVDVYRLVGGLIAEKISYVKG